MNTAPICLFTFKRKKHTELTINSLKANPEASNSNLFIFSDGPKKSSDEQEVHEVRSFLKTVTGFKSITIIERTENLGLAKNIIDGVTQVVNKFGSVIVLEDDMITSPLFLEYMNTALLKYEGNSEVISIHGYIYPVQKKLPETFFLKGADCWGWGTWKRGWDLFEQDSLKLLLELKQKTLSYEFDFYGSHPYTKMLENQALGLIDSWAIRWYASAFLKNKLTLYPGNSYVHNIGNDSSGTHCISTQQYDVQPNILPIKIWETNIAENVEVKKIISAFFSKSDKIRFKQFAKNILGRLFEIFD